MIGITAAGAYIPRTRLNREAILTANGWFNPALRSLAKGTRATCNWDEDALTMAVEAARDCFGGEDRCGIGRIVLASTSLPFGDRQNAAVVAEALNLGGGIASMDVTSSLRAGTSALAVALADSNPSLVVLSEHRQARAASAGEMAFGDAAAAFLTGGGNVIAEFIGCRSVTVDLVDHYRASQDRFDYGWEERWARDEGIMKIMPAAIAAALVKLALEPGAIARAVLPFDAASNRRIAGKAGLREEVVADSLFAEMGNAGAAHPGVILADVLAAAAPGETILVAGWGQGCDVIVLRTSDGIARRPAGPGVRGHLARGRIEANYNRYLAFNNLIEQEKGIRSELDKQTAVSALYRNRDMIVGFVGGKCSACGTVQFPRSNVCVNPNCGRFHTQEPHPMADARATVQSWTADHLTYSPDPPNHFGMVVFAEGGRLMMDFTDVGKGEVDVGTPLRLMFRIKDYDDRRGFRRYFWKAAPLSPAND